MFRIDNPYTEMDYGAMGDPRNVGNLGTTGNIGGIGEIPGYRDFW